MLLVKHMDRGGRGGRVRRLDVKTPVRGCRLVCGLGARVQSSNCSCHIYLVGDTGPNKGKDSHFLGRFCGFGQLSPMRRWRSPNRDSR